MVRPLRRFCMRSPSDDALASVVEAASDCVVTAAMIIEIEFNFKNEYFLRCCGMLPSVVLPHARRNMAYLYFATASKPSSVLKSITGNFIDENSLCLLVAKLNHFELYTLSAEGLKAFMDIPIYGTIAHAEFFRPKVSRLWDGAKI